MSDWIYVNKASVSVYRSCAKYVLEWYQEFDLPPPPPPTQDNGWLSEPPTKLCNDHDNHSQQRPDSAGWGKVRTRYLPVKPCTEHCFLLKGLCQNNPLPTPLVLPPQAWSTNPLLGQSLGYPAVPTKMPSPLLFGYSTGLEQGCAHRAKA